MPAVNKDDASVERGTGQLTLVQQRSRDRQAMILAEAAQIIAEVGSDALKMNALAQRCGISIGSLYQHFRDKGAVLSSIAERYHAATRDCIDEALDKATEWQAFANGFAGLIDDYYGMFLAEPVIRDVWSGIAADKQLQALELRSSRENGAHLARHILRVTPDADPDAVQEAAFFVMALGESVMRFAILCPPEEGHLHVARYSEMALAELARAAGVPINPANRRSSAE